MDDIMHMHLPRQRSEGIGRRSGGSWLLGHEGRRVKISTLPWGDLVITGRYRFWNFVRNFARSWGTSSNGLWEQERLLKGMVVLRHECNTTPRSESYLWCSIPVRVAPRLSNLWCRFINWYHAWSCTCALRI